jgi:CheY-like chemotaxis protein
LTRAPFGSIVVDVGEAKRRVLVVDGDPRRRLQIDRQLDLLGWESYGAGNGTEALRMLERGPRFEAMFIDALVSDLNVRGLARSAALTAPHLRIRFMAQPGTRVPPLVPLLPMPVSIEMLARTLGTPLPAWHGGRMARSRYPR